MDCSEALVCQISIVESVENSDIGYVAVTTDAGTRTLAKEKIPNFSGDIIVSLRDVKITSKDNAIEFPIYINPDLTVEFESIKVVRVK